MADERDNPEVTPKRRRWLWVLGVVAVVCLGVVWYLNSSLLQRQVRARVVSELERATGGKVQVRALTSNVWKLEFVAEDLVVRGNEPVDAKPYIEIDYLKLRLKVLSLLSRDIGVNFLAMSKPAVHIIVNADGTTNIPKPQTRPRTGRSEVDVLFDLKVDRVEVADGEFVFNNRRIPLNFDAEKVSAEFGYDYVAQNYPGKIAVGGSLVHFKEFKPLASDAEVSFVLTQKEVEIKSLRWGSPASKLEASGKVTELAKPVAQLKYRATVSLAELGATVGWTPLRNGVADVQGVARVSLDDFTTNGRLVARNAEWRSPGIAARNLEAAAQYDVTSKEMKFTNVVARVLGGNARGNLKITDWWSVENARGEGRFEVASVNADLAAGAFERSNVPLSKLNLAGKANGNVTLDWRGSPANMDVDVNVAVTAPSEVPAGRLAVSGPIKAVFHGARGTLDVSSAELRTPSSSLNVTGVLGSESGAMRIRGETTKLSELEPFIAAIGKMPVDIRGRAAFNGTVRGRFAAPIVTGRLEIADFDYALETAGQPPRTLHWDSLVADIDYSAKSLRARDAVLTRGNTRLNFSGDTTLVNGKFHDSLSVFAVRAQVQDASVSELQQIAGTDYPVNGKVRANMNVSGTLQTMRGDGRVQIADATLYGESFTTATADLRFQGKEVAANNVVLAKNGSRITGNASYNVTSEQFSFRATSERFALDALKLAQYDKLKFGGVAKFDVSGSGTTKLPVVNGRIQVTDMTVNGEPAGDLKAEAITRGQTLQLAADSNFNNATLNAKGTVNLTGDLPAQISLTFRDFSFDPLLRGYLQGRVSAKTQSEGHVELAGPLRNPKLLDIKGEITQLAAEVEQLKLINQGPITFEYRDATVHLSRFHITGDGTDLTATGSIGTTGERAISLKADGRANLKLFQGFNRDLLSHGLATLSMQGSGTVERPRMTGTVQIADAGVSLIDLPNALSDINGTLVFNENRLQITSLTARTGGGSLNLGGFIAFRNGLYFDVTATGNDIRLRYPQGVSSVANANLRYTGTTRDSLLSGEVQVTRFSITPRFDFASYLAETKNSQLAVGTYPVLDNLRVDVRVTTTPELRVETSLAKISGDADLRIRGTVSRPAVLGRVNIVEGDINFNGTKYHLERGDISFSNPVRIEPVLNIEASARVREYDITLGFNGSAEKLNTTYRSEPPLPTADIIALLALGRTREDTVLSSPTNQSFTESASNAILGQALNATISNRVQRIFGVSRIKIDPQIGGPENNPNARLTIEQSVNNNITLTYITNLSQSAQQIIQAEFTINKTVSIVAVRDQNGVVGFDIRIRQRKR